MGLILIGIIVALSMFFNRPKETVYRYNVLFWFSLLFSTILQGATSEYIMFSPFAMSMAHWVNIWPYGRLISILGDVPIKVSRLYYIQITGVGISFVVYLLGGSFTAVALPTCILSAFTVVYPVYLANKDHKQTLFFRMFSVLMLMYAIHAVDFAFLRPIESMAPIGFGIASFLMYGFGLCLPIIMLEKVKDNYSKTLENDVKERTFEIAETLEKLRYTQRQLINSEKLAAVGELVAGITHEINNPIGFSSLEADNIIEDLKVLEQSLEEGVTKSEFLKKISDVNHASYRIKDNLVHVSNLVKDFKQVAIDTKDESRMDTDVLETIRRVAESVKPSMGLHTYSIDHKVSKSIRLNINPGWIVQIITNLMLNSVKHAFEGDEMGHIKITISERTHSYCILVEDNGKGISEDIRHRIFDPFFTTRPGTMGGSGLGLSIVHNLVVNKLGGQIKVSVADLNQNKGTVFEIDIPKDGSHLNSEQLAT